MQKELDGQFEKTAADVSYMQVMRRLMGSIGEYRAASLVTPLLVLGEVVFEVLIPFRIADLVNVIKAGADLSQIVSAGGVLALMALASLAFGAAAGFTCARAACGFAKNLRRDMFHNIQTFSFTTIDRFSTSSLVTRLTTDANNVQMAYMMLIRTAVRSPFILVASFVCAWIMGGWLAIVFVVLLPLLALGLFAIIRAVMPVFRRIFRKYDALNESAEENLSGIRVVKSYVREDHEREKFDRAAGELCDDFTRVERIMALNSPFMNACVYVIFVGMIYLGSYAIISTRGGLIDVGQFSSLIAYGFMMLMSMQMLSMIFAQIVIAEEGARRIYEVLEAKTTIEEPERPVMEVPDGSIDFDHVGFSYTGDAEREALSDVDLHIAPGEVVGIIGSTGSSKSTLVQLVARLYDATEGTVRVGGRDVREYDLDALRGAVAMVLQKNVLFSGTIAENLRHGDPDASDARLWHALEVAQAGFVRDLPAGLASPVAQGGTNFSGGQRQRLAIARALVRRADLYVFDDSFSALDYKTDAALRRALADELDGASVLIIAQRVSTIRDANQIVVLSDGAVVGMGTHDELMRTCPNYRAIAESQSRGEQSNA